MLSDIAYACYHSHFIDEKIKAVTGSINSESIWTGMVRKKLKTLQQLRVWRARSSPQKETRAGGKVGMGPRNEPHRGSDNVCVALCCFSPA